MSLSNAVDALEKQEAKAEAAFDRHAKLLLKAHEMGLVNRDVMKSLFALYKEQKLMIEQIESTLQVAMKVMGGVAKNAHASGSDFATLREQLRVQALTSAKGRKARKARTEKEKFYLIRQELIRVWQTGRYQFRTTCVQFNCDKLGVRYSTGLKMLQNVPKISKK